MTESHATRAHATLAPSAASRWLNCPGSVRLCADIEDTHSSFAAEGTAAHMLAERCLSAGFDASRFKGWAVNTEAKQPNLAIQQGFNAPDGKTIFEVDAEMVDAVQLYLDVSREIIAASDEHAIEARMDMTEIIPGVFGTGDVIAYREKPTKRVTIVDLKYGKGIAVEVFENDQELTYAVGVLQRYHNRGVDEVELVIVQPRAPHKDGPVRRWITDSTGLYEHVMALQDAAKAAEDPDAPFVVGAHCSKSFCKAAGKCAALRTRVMEIVMTDPTAAFKDWKEEQADINLVGHWKKQREEFAHNEALRGRMPPGAKLVGKRAVRKWKDESEAVATLKMLDVPDDDIYDTTVKSPAQLEKALPPSQRGMLAAYVSKVSSGTVLAPLDDPRAPVDPNDAEGFDAQ